MQTCSTCAHLHMCAYVGPIHLASGEVGGPNLPEKPEKCAQLVHVSRSADVSRWVRHQIRQGYALWRMDIQQKGGDNGVFNPEKMCACADEQVCRPSRPADVRPRRPYPTIRRICGPINPNKVTKDKRKIAKRR